LKDSCLITEAGILTVFAMSVLLVCGATFSAGMGWWQRYFMMRQQIRHDSAATIEHQFHDDQLRRSMTELGSYPAISSLHLLENQIRAREEVLAQLDVLAARFECASKLERPYAQLKQSLLDLKALDSELRDVSWQLAILHLRVQEPMQIPGYL
jgi:hypothetical protein